MMVSIGPSVSPVVEMNSGDDASRYSDDVPALIAHRERNAVNNPAVVAASPGLWTQEPCCLKDLWLELFLNLPEGVLAEKTDAVVVESILKNRVSDHTRRQVRPGNSGIPFRLTIFGEQGICTHISDIAEGVDDLFLRDRLLPLLLRKGDPELASHLVQKLPVRLHVINTGVKVNDAALGATGEALKQSTLKINGQGVRIIPAVNGTLTPGSRIPILLDISNNALQVPDSISRSP